MSLNTILATTPLTSTGYHLKATGTTIGNSLIWDNGTNVGIGNTNTSYTLDVSGSLRNTTSAYFATTSGNVGIGTTTATNRLTIFGSGDQNISQTSSTLANIYGVLTNSTKQYIIGLSADLSNSYIIFDGTANAARMTITSAGNVGIGTSSPVAALDIDKAEGIMLRVKRTGVAGEFQMYQGPNVVYLDSSAASGNLAFATVGTERMRITDGGSVSINYAGPMAGAPLGVQSTAGGQQNISLWNTATSGTVYFMEFAAGSTYAPKGSITYNGSITLYNASSDYRLKEDLKEYNGLEIISKLKTYDFKWKESGTRDYGMMAHELQEILPNYVSGEKDSIDENGSIRYQGVDYSKLVPVLVKAIQEQQIQIQNLQEQINILAK